MQTIEDYAREVEHQALADLDFAASALRRDGLTIASALVADKLERLRDHIDMDGLVEATLVRDGFEVTGPHPADGLRYVRPVAVAA